VAQKLTAGLPQDLDLEELYTIRFAAVDPTTGAAVASVTVTNAQILCDNVSALPPEDLQVGPWLLIPGPDT